MRIRTWRETRGWLWPSTCASSPTESSIALSKARILSRVGSPSERKISAAAGAVGNIDKDIKISYM